MPDAIGLAAILPTKATRSGRGRRIVYLDQNIVTELAKLRLGRLRDGERTDALRELAGALRHACLERQDSRCVESFFHLWESSGLVEGAPGALAVEELFREIWQMLVVHAWGLQFHALFEITQFQTVVEVARRSGRTPYPRRLLWRAAFGKEPHASNEKHGVRVGGDLFLLGVPWQPSTMNTPGWASRVEPSRAAGHYATFDAALDELRAELRERDLEDDRRYSWANKWGDYEPLAPAAVTAFIESSEYGELPVNDVLTRVGARVLSDRGRALKDSDAADMRIMATAVPYCDLVVTDKYMASVVNALQLGEKYGATIIPSSNQGLREAAMWLATASNASSRAAAPHTE